MAALSDSNEALRLYNRISEAGFQSIDQTGACGLDTIIGVIGDAHSSGDSVNERINTIFERHRSVFYREDGTVARGDAAVARLHQMESKLRSFYNANKGLIQEVGASALNNPNEVAHDFKALAQMNNVDQRIVSLALFFAEQESLDLAAKSGAVAQPLLISEGCESGSNMLLGLYDAVINYKHWQDKDRLKEQLAETIRDNPNSIQARIETIEKGVNDIMTTLMDGPKLPKRERDLLHKEKGELCGRYQVLTAMQKELTGFATTNKDLIQNVGSDIVNNPGQLRKDAVKLRETSGMNNAAVTIAEFFAEQSANLIVSEELADFDATPAQQRDIAIAQDVSNRQSASSSSSSSQSLQWGMMPQASRRQTMPVEFWDESPNAMWEEESPMWDSPSSSPIVPPNQGPAPRDEVRVVQRVTDTKPKEAAGLDQILIDDVFDMD